MHEQMPSLGESFESRLFNAKMAIQVRLIEEKFGPQSEQVKEIISYLLVNGSRIHDIFHENPSLVDEFILNPDTVLNKIREELGN